MAIMMVNTLNPLPDQLPYLFRCKFGLLGDIQYAPIIGAVEAVVLSSSRRVLIFDFSGTQNPTN
jgi:hypothetical protein